MHTAYLPTESSLNVNMKLSKSEYCRFKFHEYQLKKLKSEELYNYNKNLILLRSFIAYRNYILKSLIVTAFWVILALYKITFKLKETRK